MNTSPATVAAPITASSGDWPPTRTAWLTTVMMTIAYVFSYLDRQVINLLAPAIKKDLALSDVELSLLQGTAFAIPFVFFGLLFGALADRVVRVRIVSFGVAVWSVMTSLCGATRSFAPLFAFRAGVGVGEAVLNPAAVSLISDQLAPTKRPRALAFYNMGTTIGAALGYILIGQLMPKENVDMPFFGSVAPWQATFLVLGAPGLLYAIAVLFLREPARRGLMATAGTMPRGAGYAAALRFLWVRRAVFLPLIMGLGLLGLLAYGPASQTTLFFTRTYGWSVSEIARFNGMLIIVSAIPGALFGGYFATRLRQQRSDGTLRAIVYASIGLILPITVLWLAPSPELAWLGQALMNFGIAASINLASAVLADVTPNELRGKVIALNAMVITLIGLGVGPSLIAMITQYVLQDEMLLRYSLVIYSAIFAPLAALTLYSALPAYGRVVEESASWTGTAK